jgi:hypothetical protein
VGIEAIDDDLAGDERTERVFDGVRCRVVAGQRGRFVGGEGVAARR